MISMAAAAVMLPACAEAVVDTPALNAYARARLADGDKAVPVAVAGYAEALAADPDNAVLALRSYRQAMAAGNMALAVRAAQVMDSAGVLPRDGVLLLAVDALGREEWARARQLADRLRTEESFAFLAPFLTSWVSLASGPYLTPAVDQTGQFAALTGRYLDEHIALQALARKDIAAATPAIRRALSLRTSTQPGLRIAIARRLAALGSRDEALAILDLDDPVLNAAKPQFGGRRFSKGPALTPQRGFGRALARLADDVGEGNSRPLALALARMASFSDPKSDEMRVAVARQLVLSSLPDIALAEAVKVTDKSPWVVAADDVQVVALARLGRSEDAMTLARNAAARPGASAAQYLQLGNLLSEADQFGPAVDSYRQAQARYPKGAIPWSLYLLEGSALERAGRWDEAKVALQNAAAIAPEEPVVLNYLGYAQVERRQNMTQALDLLRRAQALRPDDAAIADSLGWAHFVAGDSRKALPMLEKAAAGAPGDVTINEHLGDALWAVGRRYEARYAWTAARAFAEGEAAARIGGKISSGFKPEWAAH